MSAHNVILSIEICSGPLDGTGVQVGGGSFTVGHDAGCDVALPKTIGLPERAVVRAEAGADGLTLESDCDLEFEGTRTRTARGAGTVIIRIGATDLAVSVAGEEETGTESSLDEPAGDKKRCSTCGWENASGARWCANCGRDL